MKHQAHGEKRETHKSRFHAKWTVRIYDQLIGGTEEATETLCKALVDCTTTMVRTFGEEHT
jgi:hypothetical protein